MIFIIVFYNLIGGGAEGSYFQGNRSRCLGLILNPWVFIHFCCFHCQARTYDEERDDAFLLSGKKRALEAPAEPDTKKIAVKAMPVPPSLPGFGGGKAVQNATSFVRPGGLNKNKEAAPVKTGGPEPRAAGPPPKVCLKF